MNAEEELEKIFKTINTKQIKSMLENQTQTYLKISHAFILKKLLYKLKKYSKIIIDIKYNSVVSI